jgi:hypothetical protein
MEIGSRGERKWGILGDWGMQNAVVGDPFIVLNLNWLMLAQIVDNI